MEYGFKILMLVLNALALILPLMVCVALYTYAERKVIGAMQCRVGPNRVGPLGLLQPIADAIKLLFKEILVPKASNKYLFVIAPMLSIAPALSAWAVVPLSSKIIYADLNLGLLYLLAMTSLSVYGVIISGWASNSKYALLGAIRSAAQIVSYEIAMGFAIICVVLMSGTLNIKNIVLAQSGNLFTWYFLPLFPMLIIYWISALAETNRAPFDVAEGESEIVAGFHVEYSGMAFAVFFLAEYANMILVSMLAAIMFLGGWLSPLQGTFLESYFNFIPEIVWLLIKTGFFMFTFLWFRATFPRYRYDQIMRLGWKVFIPITIFWVFLIASAKKFMLGPWFV